MNRNIFFLSVLSVSLLSLPVISWADTQKSSEGNTAIIYSPALGLNKKEAIVLENWIRANFIECVFGKTCYWEKWNLPRSTIPKLRTKFFDNEMAATDEFADGTEYIFSEFALGRMYRNKEGDIVISYESKKAPKIEAVFTRPSEEVKDWLSSFKRGSLLTISAKVLGIKENGTLVLTDAGLPINEVMKLAVEESDKINKALEFRSKNAGKSNSEELEELLALIKARAKSLPKKSPCFTPNNFRDETVSCLRDLEKYSEKINKALEEE